MNFAQDILDEAGDEQIEGIVIGNYSTSTYYHEDEPKNVPRRGVMLTWNEAFPYLDYEYDNGFGTAECHAITAWTTTKVIFVSEYDGATCVVSIPRHPTKHEPAMI